MHTIIHSCGTTESASSLQGLAIPVLFSETSAVD